MKHELFVGDEHQEAMTSYLNLKQSTDGFCSEHVEIKQETLSREHKELENVLKGSDGPASGKPGELMDEQELVAALAPPLQPRARV